MQFLGGWTSALLTQHLLQQPVPFSSMLTSKRVKLSRADSSRPQVARAAFGRPQGKKPPKAKGNLLDAAEQSTLADNTTSFRGTQDKQLQGSSTTRSANTPTPVRKQSHASDVGSTSTPGRHVPVAPSRISSSYKQRSAAATLSRPQPVFSPSDSSSGHGSDALRNGSSANMGNSSRSPPAIMPRRSKLVAQVDRERADEDRQREETRMLREAMQKQREDARPAKPNLKGRIDVWGVGFKCPGISAEARPHVTAAKEFFAKRKISDETLRQNQVFMHHVFCPAKNEQVYAIAFPYLKGGEIVNIKYRTLDKVFWQVKKAEKVLYGYDDIVKGLQAGETNIIFVEGEMDKLALNAAGFDNVVSVPDGAPATAEDEVTGNGSSNAYRSGVGTGVKYSYLGNCREILEAQTKVVLATDNDKPGQLLAQSLSRRLGKERCWTVQWPAKGSGPPSGDVVPEVELSTVDMQHARMHASSSNGLNNGNVLAGEVTPLLAAQSNGYSPSSVTADDASLTQDDGFRKDANEVLMKDGPERLQKLLADAKAIPIAGLYQFRDHWSEILDLYNQVNPDAIGVSTGWPSLDPYYKVVPGELCIVTGVPNSGKSEWIDALLVNLAKSHGWCFAYCALEKSPRDHARQLLEKYVGKPFHTHYSAMLGDRMSWTELAGGLDWLEEHFHIISYSQSDTRQPVFGGRKAGLGAERRQGLPTYDTGSPSIDWILDTARAAVLKFGIRGLVIDPYNEIDHERPSYMSETEYVSSILSKIKRFAQMYEVHVWFVAHPRQMHGWAGGAPNLYDISGSAHFINKTDVGIVVHRSWASPDSKSAKAGAPPPDPSQVSILVRKVRNKAAGQIGQAVLRYDRPTGMYHDPNSFSAAGSTVEVSVHSRQQQGMPNVAAVQAPAPMLQAPLQASSAVQTPVQVPAPRTEVLAEAGVPSLWEALVKDAVAGQGGAVDQVSAQGTDLAGGESSSSKVPGSQSAETAAHQANKGSATGMPADQVTISSTGRAAARHFKPVERPSDKPVSDEDEGEVESDDAKPSGKTYLEELLSLCEGLKAEDIGSQNQLSARNKKWEQDQRVD